MCAFRLLIHMVEIMTTSLQSCWAAWRYLYTVWYIVGTEWTVTILSFIFGAPTTSDSRSPRQANILSLLHTGAPAAPCTISPIPDLSVLSSSNSLGQALPLPGHIPYHPLGPHNQCFILCTMCFVLLRVRYLHNWLPTLPWKDIVFPFLCTSQPTLPSLPQH